MVLGRLKSPSLNVGRFADFVSSDTAIVVLGAVVVTPIMFGVISTFVTSKLGITRDNLMIALFVASIILFVISTVFSGKLRMLFLGASAGALIQAITQSTLGQNILDRLEAAVPGA